MKDEQRRNPAGVEARAAKLRDRLVEQALKRFLPQIEACGPDGELTVSADELAVVLGLLKASLPSQATVVEAAYDRAISNTERTFRRNKDRSWVVKILREHVEAEFAALAKPPVDPAPGAKSGP